MAGVRLGAVLNQALGDEVASTASPSRAASGASDCTGGPKNITFLRLTAAGWELINAKWGLEALPGLGLEAPPGLGLKAPPNIQEVSSNKLPQDSCGLSPAGSKAGDSGTKSHDVLDKIHKPKLTLADVWVQTLAEIQGTDVVLRVICGSDWMRHRSGGHGRDHPRRKRLPLTTIPLPASAA